MPEGLHDLRGPVDIPGLPWWGWALMAIALVLGAILILFLWKRFVRPPASPPPVVIPPWEKALEALQGLKSRTWSGPLIKEYYFHLSRIVRCYIEERFDIKAPEMTTEEFMQKAASSSSLSSEHRDLLLRLLDASDLVKFAKAEPTSKDMEDAFASAKYFIEATRPVQPEGGTA